ncbi:MAG: NUDIX domain-containing protein, partial [Bacteroidetes bacterium]|nr:NUDIX domain-containing protein [Bacteroidota bacterium]
PHPGEVPVNAAKRRLKEEMGLKCELYLADKFIYYSDLDDDLAEHELDYVYIGYTDVKPIPNPLEVCDWRYISLDNLALELNRKPEKFTSWFHIMCEKGIIKFVNDDLALLN